MDSATYTRDFWQAKAGALKFRTQHFIDGSYVASADGRTFPTINPATGAAITEVARGGEAEIDRAVAAARKAFKSGSWSRLDPRARMAVLEKFSALVEAHAEEFAVLDSLDMGKPVMDMMNIDIPGSVMSLKFFSETIDKIEGAVTSTTASALHYILRQPLGVVGLIVPWNYPLMMAAWKLGPALATGNSVVLKPAEQSPLSANLLAELFIEAGGPSGVLNVVHGLGEEAGKALALQIADTALERLPRSGVAGLAQEMKRPVAEVDEAVQLLRTLDPKPGAQVGDLSHDTYVVPDCVVWRQRGVWRAALAGNTLPRIAIHRGYEQMIRQCGDSDAGYLKAQLQEARWLLKSVEARGETLLKVMRCLLHQQAGFLEFGEQALRPLTLRDVAEEVGLHESTVSRAIARKYVRTPRGTLPMRAFFASGIDTEGGGEASSTAIQAMIRRLVDGENPRKPLSDAKLADLLKASGVPVARRTVAKYREAMNILSSHERVRIG